MYTRFRLGTDGGLTARRYVETVTWSDVQERFEAARHRVTGVNPSVYDAILATAFVVFSLIALLAAEAKNFDYRDPDALGVIATLGATVPYYWRRRSPLIVLLVSDISVVTLAVGSYQTGATPSILLIGMYTVASWSPPRDRAIGALAILAGLTTVAVAAAPGLDGAGMAINYILFAGAYLFGAWTRTRRLYARGLEERAETLERERDEEAKRAVAEERLRIAQECTTSLPTRWA
jgi:signal transduction histidine kinase